MGYTKDAGYGRALLNMIQNQVPAFGRIMVVKNSTLTADDNYQKLQDLFTPDSGLVRFFTSLEDAYAACTSNNNDVILLDGGSTSHKISAQIAWSKNKIHVFGMQGAARKIGARCLVSNTGTGAATDVAMLYITGTGNTFKNISFKNNWSAAEAIYCIKDWGIQTVMENCDIEHLGATHLTTNTTAALNMGGNECIYTNCTIGEDTLLVTGATSTGGQEILITNRGSAATKSTRSRFEHCRFQTYTSDATRVLVRSSDVSIDRDITFEECELCNVTAATSAVTLTTAIMAHATSGGHMYRAYQRVYGATDFCTAAVGSVGVLNVAPVSVAAATEGIRPTA